MKYDYQISPRKKQRFLKKFYIFTIALFILAALAAGLIRLDSYLQNRQNTPDKTTSEQTTAFFDSKNQIYRTQYFQFQSRNSWNEIPAESSDTKFVYRNLKGSLIEDELVVYVNSIPGNLHATRVLPISLKSNNDQLEPGTVSEHCISALKGVSSSMDKQVSFEGVTMNCDSDSTLYEVLVGLKGGSTKLTLDRPGDSQATYSIFYRNVQATPTSDQLLQIISSFQTR